MPHACDEGGRRVVVRACTAVVLVLAVATGGGGGRAGAAARVADMVWDELADCESGGDWQADTGNGYYGGLQIQPSTWAESDGLRFADRPDRASRREQTTVGEAIVRRQGWEAWPSCARELGLLGGGSGAAGGHRAGLGQGPAGPG
ncbi:transglycosylase family protein [Kitasatospora xanthocidica]|uniref:transglycosylase family protein n=1 Tax=Kitasatospora xanthocidica TaxID=83382 RepID=UPI00167500DE|nr:transglycosylase family protein [Kitasatospora xanthocidica]